SDTKLALRAARWSAAHWKTAAVGWIAFAVLAVAVGNMVGARQMKSWAISNGESRRAEQILAQADFRAPARESVLVESSRLSAGDPAFTAVVAAVARRLAAEPNVVGVMTPLDQPGVGLVSRDGHSALV